MPFVGPNHHFGPKKHTETLRQFCIPNYNFCLFSMDLYAKRILVLSAGPLFWKIDLRLLKQSLFGIFTEYSKCPNHVRRGSFGKKYSWEEELNYNIQQEQFKTCFKTIVK